MTVFFLDYQIKLNNWRQKIKAILQGFRLNDPKIDSIRAFEPRLIQVATVIYNHVTIGVTKNINIDGSKTKRVDWPNGKYSPWSDLELSHSNEDRSIIKVTSSGF